MISVFYALLARAARLFGGIVALGGLAGCATLSYYSQSIQGHFDLMSRARPVKELLEDPNIPEKTRAQLRLTQEVRDFASREMLLPENGSYRQYADLGRPYVVWNVVATTEFSTKPYKWCFLVAGCLNYRGYFKKADAQAMAARLQAEGMDVYITGADAYSTLGWFDDPLVSPMFKRAEPSLVDIIIHELAHQKLYIDNDSAFNEAFASAVAWEGVRRWYQEQGQPEAYRRYLQSLERRQAFHSLLIDTRKKLTALYQMPLSQEEMRLEKANLLAELREDYQTLKAAWGGFDGYDSWINQDLNNAHLAMVATYQEWVPAFLTLLEEHGGNLNAFYATTRSLGGLPTAERQVWLAQLREPKSQPVLSYLGEEL